MSGHRADAVAVDRGGNVWIADTGRGAVRCVSAAEDVHAVEEPICLATDHAPERVWVLGRSGDLTRVDATGPTRIAALGSGLALTVGSTRAFAASSSPARTWSVDLDSGAATEVGVGGEADLRALALAPDGRRLYAAAGPAILELDLEQARSRTLHRRQTPECFSGLAMSPAGLVATIAEAGLLVGINLRSGATTTIGRDLGRPTGVAADPGERRYLVVDAATSGIRAIASDGSATAALEWPLRPLPG